MISIAKISWNLLPVTLTATVFCTDVLSDKLFNELYNFYEQPNNAVPYHPESLFDPEYLNKVENILQRRYGEREVSYFRYFCNIGCFMSNSSRNMIKEFKDSYDQGLDDEPLIDDSIKEHLNEHFEGEYLEDYRKLEDENTTSNELKTARMLILLVKQQFEMFKRIKEQYIKPNVSRFTEIRALAYGFENTDTPCSTQAGCDRLEMLMNLCTHIRGGIQYGYDIFSTMVHVLGNMFAVLCGCIFVGPIQLCFLKNFPVSRRSVVFILLQISHLYAATRDGMAIEDNTSSSHIPIVYMPHSVPGVQQVISGNF